MAPRARKIVEEQPNPFGEDQVEGDEAQTEFEWSGTFEMKEDTMTTPDQNHCTMILKGKGYDAPSISIRGGNIQDLHNQVMDNAKLLEELITRAAAMGKTFNEAFAGSEKAGGGGYTNRGQNSSQGGSQARTEGRPAAATQGPWGEQSCKHGVMTFKSGQGDDGSFWQGYFCPAPRGATDKCKNKYVK